MEIVGKGLTDCQVDPTGSRCPSPCPPRMPAVWPLPWSASTGRSGARHSTSRSPKMATYLSTVKPCFSKNGWAAGVFRKSTKACASGLVELASSAIG